MELLAVLGVIALLAAILVPVVAGARIASQRVATRARFAQWITAVEAFRAEYGHYPAFPHDKVNGAAGASGTAPVADDFRFRELLAGAGSGAAPGGVAAFQSSEANLISGTPRAQNRRRIAFHAFGGAEVAEDGAVLDAFGNRDITVLCDHDGDGVIPATEILAATAQVRPPTGDAASPPVEAVPPAGVRAAVVFFSAGVGWHGTAIEREHVVASWK